MGEKEDLKEFADLVKENEKRYQEGISRAHERIDEMQKIVSVFDGRTGTLEVSINNLNNTVAAFYKEQNEKMWKLIYWLIAIFSALLGAERIITNFVGK